MTLWRALQHIREGFLHNRDVRMGVLLPGTKQKHHVSYGIWRTPHGVSDDEWYCMTGNDEITIKVMRSLPLIPFWLLYEWFVEYKVDGSWGVTFTDEEDPILSEGSVVVNRDKTVWDHLLGE